MNPFNEENIILKKLQDFYDAQQEKSQQNEKFKVQEEKNLKKIYVYHIFFEYNLIDNCGYNIFQISEFLHQLKPDSDEINVQHFYSPPRIDK